MKKMTLACALLTLAMLVSGCDFFRKMAGRPTSADIAELRALIEAEEREDALKKEAVLKARRDSIEAFSRDSAAMAEAAGRREFVVSGTTLLTPSVKQELPARFFVIIGAFRDAGNASKLADSINAKGHKAVLISYRNGCTAVGLDPSGTLVDAYRAFQSAKSDGLCPKDAWILDTNL